MSLSIATKTTYKARHDLAPDKKLTATEVNQIVRTINSQGSSIENIKNYLQVLFAVDDENILQAISSILEEPFYLEASQSLAIAKAGAYVFKGGNEGRTFTINDNIQGMVEVRSLATVDLALEGKFAPSFSPIIYPNSAVRFFRWSSDQGFYMY